MDIFADDLSEYNKEPEMLTPSGMRQRYLKGCYNRVRFADLLSTDYVPGEIYIQSTNKKRTMQSA